MGPAQIAVTALLRVVADSSHVMKSAALSVLKIVLFRILGTNSDR
jgi:hypothetical protein